MNIIYSGPHLNEAQVRNSDPSIPMQNSPKSNLEKTLRAILTNTESALESVEKLLVDWWSLKSNITVLLQNSIDSNLSSELKQNRSLPYQSMEKDIMSLASIQDTFIEYNPNIVVLLAEIHTEKSIKPANNLDVKKPSDSTYEFRSASHQTHSFNARPNWARPNDQKQSLPPESATPCPYCLFVCLEFVCLFGRGWCIKANKCDYSHQNYDGESKIPKNKVPCPFLKRRGFCLKGMSCDFLHVPISQWSQREGEKFPFFQKLHGVITTLEMVDKRLQRIENGRLNLGQLTTAFSNPSFTRRTQHTSYPPPQFPPGRRSPHIPSPRPLMDIPVYRPDFQGYQRLF